MTWLDDITWRAWWIMKTLWIVGSRADKLCLHPMLGTWSNGWKTIPCRRQGIWRGTGGGTRGGGRDSVDVARALLVAALAPTSLPSPSLPPSPPLARGIGGVAALATLCWLAGWLFCLPRFLRYYLRALAPPLLRYIVAVHRLFPALPLPCDGVPSPSSLALTPQISSSATVARLWSASDCLRRLHR